MKIILITVFVSGFAAGCSLTILVRTILRRRRWAREMRDRSRELDEYLAKLRKLGMIP